MTASPITGHAGGGPAAAASRVPAHDIKGGLAAMGLIAIIGQVLMMRELAAVFYGNELVYGLALAVWMLWVAAGARLGGRLTARFDRPGAAIPRVMAAGLLASAAALPFQMAFVRGFRPLLGYPPGAFVGLGTMCWVTALALAPVCLLTGVLFALGAGLLTRGGEGAGGAYAWESAGSLAGGVAFTFVLVSWLDPFQTALVAGGVALAASGWLATTPAPGRRRSAVLSLALFWAVAGLPLGSMLHQRTLDWEWPDRIYAGDSRYGRLAITAHGGQYAFFQDGRLVFETQSTYPEEVAQLPLLAHPDPRRVMLIGGAVDGTLRQVLRHPVESVVVVELDPLVVQAAREYLPPTETAVLDDPRVRLVLGDGRRAVREQSGAMDAVILNLPEPATGQVNRFYTREFFAEVRAILAPGGLLALGLPSAENYWNPELARRNASVYRTLESVYAYVAVAPGETDFYLAADTPLELDPAVLAQRMGARDVAGRWVTPAYLELLLRGDRFSQVQSQLAGETGARLNRDLAPICYYYDMVLWLSRFYGRIRGVFESETAARLLWLAPLLVGTLALAGGSRERRLTAVAGVSGFSQMTLEITLILAFQSLHGYLYQQLGLIMAAFLGGMALGAWWAGRSFPRGTRFARLPFPLLATALLAAILPLALPARLPAFLFPLLALVAGAQGGALFALAAAALRESRAAEDVAGPLYAADLVGGCAGALAAAGFLVPVAGIVPTCLSISALNLAAAALTGRVSAGGLSRAG